MIKSHTPQAWQTDPNQVQSERVQFWSDGVMVTAQMPLEAARARIDGGRAFVINGQAIGAMVEGEMRS